MNEVLKRFIIKNINMEKVESDGYDSFIGETGMKFEVINTGVMGYKVETTDKNGIHSLLGFI
ncbi:MAG: hypothetical protein ABF991_00045 [Liquorilactobacillus hordei]|uniref:hypothetical protein n=1 Tax=Liquorilactobacillus hordei TaxID=468911 RepID=UPI0039E91345